MAEITEVSIGGGRWLDAGAAGSYLRARDAGLPAGVTSAGRDWDDQMYLYNGWVAQKPGFNFALHPSRSLHCLGRAVDLPGSINDVRTARGWMRKYGRAYGWTPVTNEEWHFEYNAANDKHKEDDMPLNDADKKWIRDTVNASVSAAVRGLLTAERSIKHTDLSLSLIEAAGFDHDDAVKFGDTAAYAQAIAFGVKALVDRDAASGIDYDRLAQAVNDDAARRLAN